MERASLVSAVRAAAQRRGRVLTLDQALGLGASRKAMAGLVRIGMFDRPFPGVYVLAGAAGDPGAGHEVAGRAALAALGPAAAASHRSAAWLLGLVDRPPGVVQVTVPSPFSRRLPGVEIHRSAGPLPTRPGRGVRCTDVPRTLVDLAVGVPAGELDDALDRALARGLTRMSDLAGELSGTTRHGSKALRRRLEVLGYLGSPEPSVLERKMSRLLARHRLPVPRIELSTGPDGRYRIDFAYPERKLAIEVNGYVWHHSPEQMARDQARQRALVLAGWTVLVYGWRDVVRNGARVAAEISAAYARCP